MLILYSFFCILIFYSPSIYTLKCDNFFSFFRTDCIYLSSILSTEIKFVFFIKLTYCSSIESHNNHCHTISCSSSSLSQHKLSSPLLCCYVSPPETLPQYDIRYWPGWDSTEASLRGCVWRVWAACWCSWWCPRVSGRCWAGGGASSSLSSSPHHHQTRIQPWNNTRRNTGSWSCWGGMVVCTPGWDHPPGQHSLQSTPVQLWSSSQLCKMNSSLLIFQN